MDLSRLQAINDKKAQVAKEKQAEHKQNLSNIDLQETIVKTVKTAVEYLEGKTTKTVVMNQIKDFATHQDADKFNSSITSLHDTLKKHKNTDTAPITDALKSVLDEVKKIPKDHATPVKHQFVDYTATLKTLISKVEDVTKSVKARKTIVEAPVVNVDAPIVNVDAPDLKPLQTGLKAVVNAVDKSAKEASKVEYAKPLITEKFDEWRIQEESFMDEEATPTGITYYYKNKKVAQLKYRIKEGRIVGAKKVAVK